MAKAIPDGFHTVTPHLMMENASEAIDFYKKAFGAEEVLRMPGPDGSVIHAEIQIGTSRVMLAEANPQFGIKGPKALGGSPVTIHLYVEDTDAFMEQAAKAGAQITMPAMDMFWGDRYGKLKDPYGHDWGVATHIKDLTPEEIMKGQEEFFKANKPC